MSEHWAYHLIGKPYSKGGAGDPPCEGPDYFNCWGLVRWVFQSCFGVEMPLLRIGLGTVEQDKEIREAARISGWRLSPDTKPQDRDIVLMWGSDGRHVAIALFINNGMYALHALEGVGVVLTPYSELWLLGFSGITNWRKA